MPEGETSKRRQLLETAWVFLRLGCVSFGGPIAHLGYFRTELVERRRWLRDSHYADLLALCQVLPGPSSSQMVFALGMHRAGIAGAFAASLCFTLPSALLMIALAYSMAGTSTLASAGWLHGLKLATVAVVAQAVWGMGKTLCIDRARVSICLVAAITLLMFPGALSQLAVIALGGVVGLKLYGAAVPVEPGPVEAGGRHRVAVAALLAFASLLVLLPALAALSGRREIAAFDAFYRAGALVFGGGHVVLPLLRAAVLPHGWVTDDQFLAGYGAAQALPGPMFAFSAYVGALMETGPLRWLHGFWCLLAIFLPSWLLVGGVLPFWQRLRGTRWAQATILGSNAAVVGILLAALYDPLFTGSVRRLPDFAAVLVAFGLLEHWKAPPWLVVAASAAAGAWFLAP